MCSTGALALARPRPHTCYFKWIGVSTHLMHTWIRVRDTFDGRFYHSAHLQLALPLEPHGPNRGREPGVRAARLPARNKGGQQTGHTE
jgi:hypothetical protein